VTEKVRFFVRSAVLNLWHFRTRNIFSVTIICLSFLTVGIFLSLSNNLRHTARELQNNMTIAFFLDKDLPAADLETLEAEIRRARFIESVRLVTPEEALERFRAGFPELEDIVSSLAENPFPPSIEARVKSQASDSGEIVAFVDSLRKHPGVTDVQFNQDWVEKMQSFSRLAGAIGFFLGGILILASFFIISNVIKLNVIARHNEIEILRLVGSTNLFIRVPFLIEGTVLGLAGSALSLLLLFTVLEAFPLYLGSSLGALGELLSFRYPSFSQAVALLAAGAGIGFAGSLTSVSKFLKV